MVFVTLQKLISISNTNFIEKKNWMKDILSVVMLLFPFDLFKILINFNILLIFKDFTAQFKGLSEYEEKYKFFCPLIFFLIKLNEFHVHLRKKAAYLLIVTHISKTKWIFCKIWSISTLQMLSWASHGCRVVVSSWAKSLSKSPWSNWIIIRWISWIMVCRSWRVGYDSGVVVVIRSATTIIPKSIIVKEIADR